MSSEDSDAQIAIDVARAQLGPVRIAMPGKISAYDHTTQRAKIKLIVQWAYRKKDGSIEQYDPPILDGVPVQFMSAAGRAVTHPLSVGDEVQVLVNDRSIDEYLSTAADSTTPRDLRRFDISDAVCWPVNIAAEIPSAGVDSVATVIYAPEVKLGSSGATKTVALSPDVDNQNTLLANVFSTWVPVPNDGGAALKALLTTLIATGWPFATGATKVKAE